MFGNFTCDEMIAFSLEQTLRVLYLLPFVISSSLKGGLADLLIPRVLMSVPAPALQDIPSIAKEIQMFLDF